MGRSGPAGATSPTERRTIMKNRVFAILLILVLLLGILAMGVFGEPEEAAPAEEETVTEQEPGTQEPDPSQEPADPTEDPAEPADPAEEPEEEPASQPEQRPAAQPTASLVITREGAGNGQPYVYSVADPEGRVTYVILRGSESSVKLVGLRPGVTYTVTELAQWSWRQPDGGSQSVTAVVGTVTAEFSAVRGETNGDWLSGNSVSAKEG